MTNHVRTSQYFLQIIKCKKSDCCSVMRTNWNSVFPNRCIPAPVPLRKEEEGPIIPTPADLKSSDRFAGLWQRLAISNLTFETDLPYDSYCPSIKKEIVRRRCKSCKVYFTSIAAVQRHKRGNGCSTGRDEDEEEELIEDNEIADLTTADPENEDTAPVVDVVKLLTENPFMEIDIVNQEGDEV